MTARDLAATARAWATADPHTNTSPDDLLIALADALDALERQAADAQASREAKEGEILRLLETAAAGFMRERALEARAVRAEEALRQISERANALVTAIAAENKARDQGYWNKQHRMAVAASSMSLEAALAAAGADTEGADAVQES